MSTQIFTIDTYKNKGQIIKRTKYKYLLPKTNGKRDTTQIFYVILT